MNFLKTKLTALILVVVLIGLLGGCCGKDDKANKEIYSITVGQKFCPAMLKNDINVWIINETQDYTKYVIQHKSLCVPSRPRYIYRRNADSVIVAIYTD